MGDHIYYNIKINNNTDSLIRADYSQTFTKFLIDHANEYNLAITRFIVPRSNIPLNVFRIVEGVLQSNRDLGEYTLTMMVNAFNFSHTEHVIFHPYLETPYPPSPPSENNGVQSTSGYYFIFCADYWCQLFNETFATLFASIKASVPGISPTVAPFLTYDGKSELFTLYLQPGFLNGEVDIYYNVKTFQLLGHIANPVVDDLSYDSNFHYKITGGFDGGALGLNEVFKNGVSTGLYAYEQKLKFVGNFSSFRKLLFMSFQLPIQSEVENIGEQNQSSVSLLTDYLSTADNGSPGYIEFQNQGVYRYIDLINDLPLRDFGLSIAWEDEKGTIRPLMILPNNTVDIKIALIRRGLVS